MAGVVLGASAEVPLIFLLPRMAPLDVVDELCFLAWLMVRDSPWFSSA